MTGFWVVGTELHLPSVPPAPCTFISLSFSAVPSQLPYVCLSASWCPASLTSFEEPSLTTAASTEFFVSQLLSHWWSTPEVANNHSSFKFILKISCHHWKNRHFLTVLTSGFSSIFQRSQHSMLSTVETSIQLWEWLQPEPLQPGPTTAFATLVYTIDRHVLALCPVCLMAVTCLCVCLMCPS